MKVWPRDAKVAKRIKHPGTGVGFTENLQKSAEWPDDSFTFRRIRDGVVLKEPPGHAQVRTQVKK